MIAGECNISCGPDEKLFAICHQLLNYSSTRSVWRYQMGNQNPYIEGQTR